MRPRARIEAQQQTIADLRFELGIAKGDSAQAPHPGLPQGATLDKKTLADLLGVSVKTIQRWETQGLPRHKYDPGRTQSPVRYDPHEVALWLKRKRDRA